MESIWATETSLQTIIHQSQEALQSLQQQKEYVTDQQSVLEQVSADLELQRKENGELQSLINQSTSTIEELKKQLGSTSSKRQQCAKGMVHLRDALEAEFWKIAAIINEKHALVEAHHRLTHDHKHVTNEVNQLTSQLHQLQSSLVEIQEKLQNNSLSSGEILLLKIPTVAFKCILGYCSTPTILSLSSTNRNILGRMESMQGGRPRNLLLYPTNSSSSTTLSCLENNDGSGGFTNNISSSLSASTQSAANAAKEGILRAVAVVHNSIPQWSPHLQGGHNPTLSSDTSSSSIKDTNDDPLLSDNFSLSSVGTDTTSNPVLPPTVPPTAANRSRNGSFGNSPGGIFGFSLGSSSSNSANSNKGNNGSSSTNNKNTSTKDNAPITPAKSSNDKSSTTASLLSPGSFLTPGKNSTGGPPSTTDNEKNGTNEKIDYKKIGELMTKLKTTNANLVNAKRIIDDLKIKLTTADNVKKYLAEKVKEAEELTNKTIADKDAALFEKNQNVEVMMFLDEKVLTLESQITEQNQIIKDQKKEITVLQKELTVRKKELSEREASAQSTETELSNEINLLTDRNRALAEGKEQYAYQLREALGKIEMLEKLTLSSDFMLNSSEEPKKKEERIPRTGKTSKIENEEKQTIPVVSGSGHANTGLNLPTDTPVNSGSMTKTAYQQHIDNLTAELMTARTEIANQKKQLDTFAAEKHKAGSTLPANVNPSWTSDKSEITQLKLDLVKARKERDDAKVALLTANADIDEWKQKYSTLKTKTTAGIPASTADQSNGKVTEMRNEEIQQLQTENHKLKDETTILLDQIKKQENEYEVMREKVRLLTEQIQRGEEESSTLRERIHELESKLQEANEALKNTSTTKDSSSVSSVTLPSLSSSSVVTSGSASSILQAQYDKLVAEHHSAETTWKFQRTTLAKEIKKLRAERDELLQRLGEPVQG